MLLALLVVQVALLLQVLDQQNLQAVMGEQPKLDQIEPAVVGVVVQEIT